MLPNVRQFERGARRASAFKANARGDRAPRDAETRHVQIFAAAQRYRTSGELPFPGPSAPPHARGEPFFRPRSDARWRPDAHPPPWKRAAPALMEKFSPLGDFECPAVPLAILRADIIAFMT
jgi:hypothetical protein